MKRNLLIVSALTATVACFSLLGGLKGDAQEASHKHPEASPALPMGKTKSPEGAKVYIISPKDGETVSSPVLVQFGLKGMGVAPAGVYVSEETPTGHHHLMIDAAEMPHADLPFPKDETHLHFGGGQTEAEITLEPGEHTLQLVLGDHNHVPHDPPVVSEKITITVK